MNPKRAGLMTEESRVVLDGVDRYQVMDALFEGVRVILSYRGEPYSAAYVQGISGAAFRIGGICPCAPTCTSAMETQDLPASRESKRRCVRLGSVPSGDWDEWAAVK